MAINAILTDESLAKTSEAVNNDWDVIPSKFAVTDVLGTLDPARTGASVSNLKVIDGTLDTLPVSAARRVNDTTIQINNSIPPGSGMGVDIEIREIYIWAKSGDIDYEERIYQDDIDINNNTFKTQYNWVTGTKVSIATTEVLPIPLAANTVYYVIKDSEVTFKLAASYADAIAGTAIDITDTGAGTQIITKADFRDTSTDVDDAQDTILTDYTWLTGMEIKFEVMSGALPAPLQADRTYFVINSTTGSLKVADTKADALGNVPITLTDQGSGEFIIRSYEYLYVIAQPDSTITYTPTGTTTFKIQVGFTGASPDDVFNFQYTQATEVEDHNEDPNAHPYLSQALDLAGIFPNPPPTPDYKGQYYDQYATFVATGTPVTGEVVYITDTGEYAKAIDDGTEKAHWIGVANIEDGTVIKSGFVQIPHTYEPGTVLYLSQLVEGAITHVKSRTLVGISIGDNYVCLNDEIVNPNVGAAAFSVDFHASVANRDIVYYNVGEGVYYPAIDDGSVASKWVGVADTERNLVMFDSYVDVGHALTVGNELYLSQVDPGKVTETPSQIPLGLALPDGYLALRTSSVDPVIPLRIPGASFHAAVVDGDIVYMHSDNTYHQAIADGTDAEKWVGVADLANGEVIYGNYVTIDGTFTDGTPLFLSDTVPGDVTDTDTGIPVAVSRGGSLAFLRGKTEDPLSQITIDINPATDLDALVKDRDIVYKSPSDDKYYQARASGLEHQNYIGIVDLPRSVIIPIGLIQIDDYAAYAYNSPVYLSDVESGKLVQSGNIQVGIHLMNGMVLMGAGAKAGSGSINAFDDTEATNSSTGAIVTNGGMGVGKKVYIASPENPINKYTGALVLENGGIGVRQDAWIGGNVIVDGGIKVKSTLLVTDILNSRVGVKMENPSADFHVNRIIELGLPDTDNGIIRTSKSLIINIDSDNNSSSEAFSIYKDRAEESAGVGLFTVTEGGLLGLTAPNPGAKIDTEHLTDLSAFRVQTLTTDFVASTTEGLIDISNESSNTIRPFIALHQVATPNAASQYILVEEEGIPSFLVAAGGTTTIKGGLHVDGLAFNVDPDSHNTGIGVAVGQAKLHVNTHSNGLYSAIFENTHDFGQGIYINNTISALLSYSLIRADTNGITRMRVSNSGDFYIYGNTGFGTTIPNAKVDVNGDMIVGSDLTVDDNTLKVNATTHWVGVKTPNPTCEFDVVGTGKFQNSLTADGSTFVVDHINHRVAIGKYDPLDKFEVDGNVSFSSKLKVSGSEQATSLATGTLQIPDGGASVGGNLYVGGNIILDGVLVSGESLALPTLTISDNTNAINKDTGALIVQSGGVAVELDIWTGGSLTVEGNIALYHDIYVATDVFRVDSVNRRAGINTDTPIVGLHAKGVTIGQYVQLLEQTEGGFGLDIWTDGTQPAQYMLNCETGAVPGAGESMFNVDNIGRGYFAKALSVGEGYLELKELGGDPAESLQDERARLFVKKDLGTTKLFIQSGASSTEIGASGITVAEFNEGDIALDVLSIDHNKGKMYPVITIYDNEDNVVEPDQVHCPNADTIHINLKSFRPLEGTWHCSLVF